MIPLIYVLLLPKLWIPIVLINVHDKDEDAGTA